MDSTTSKRAIFRLTVSVTPSWHSLVGNEGRSTLSYQILYSGQEQGQFNSKVSKFFRGLFRYLYINWMLIVFLREAAGLGCNNENDSRRCWWPNDVLDFARPSCGTLELTGWPKWIGNGLNFPQDGQTLAEFHDWTSHTQSTDNQKFVCLKFHRFSRMNF